MPADTKRREAVGPDHQLSGPAAQPPRPKAMRVIIWSALILVLVLVFLLVWHLMGAKKAAPAAKKITVTTATATKGDIGVYLDAIGTVTPVYTASITSQVTGLVVAVHYKEGQRVAKGDPLVDIDPRPFRATLLQAQGALERDENVLAQAEMDVIRYRIAWGRRAIAKQILDDQEKLVLQDRGTVKNDQGMVDFAQVQLDFCHITAPIAGRVGLRLVDPGNVVQSAGTVTLAVITQLEPITVVFTIPEDSIDQVQAGRRTNPSLTVDAFDRSQQTKLATGKLLTLDNQIDTSTGTVRFRGQFENADLKLYPNQFVNARLLVKTLTNAVLIPTAGVQHNGTQAFVYVVSGNTVHIRTINELTTENGMAAVTGLNAEETVPITGFDKLQDGSKINIEGQSGKTPSASGGQ